MAVAALAVSLVGTEPPTEFRLFVDGWNDTEKGRVLFDDEARRSVMAAYQRHGIDRMLDLEHLSLDDQAPNYDPDARAWFGLELRGGELWAVNVRWTDDGAHRVKARKQRYISPAFTYDTETGRVRSIFNVALTAIPATHGTPALIAATGRKRLSSMNPEMVAAALQAMMKNDSKAMAKILQDIIANAATVGSGPVETPAPPPEPEPVAEMADEPAEDEEPAAVVAATARLLRLTAAKTLSGSVVEVERWRESHLSLQAERAKLTKEREAIESSERVELVTSLVTLGAELPATAWAPDDKGLPKAGSPSPELAAMPIASLRARAAKFAAAKPNLEIKPPVGGAAPEEGGQSFTVNGVTVALTASQLKACEDAKAKPEIFAANLLARRQAQKV